MASPNTHVSHKAICEGRDESVRLYKTPTGRPVRRCLECGRFQVQHPDPPRAVTRFWCRDHDLPTDATGRACTGCRSDRDARHAIRDRPRPDPDEWGQP